MDNQIQIPDLLLERGLSKLLKLLLKGSQVNSCSDQVFQQVRMLSRFGPGVILCPSSLCLRKCKIQIATSINFLMVVQVVYISRHLRN